MFNYHIFRVQSANSTCIAHRPDPRRTALGRPSLTRTRARPNARGNLVNAYRLSPVTRSRNDHFVSLSLASFLPPFASYFLLLLFLHLFFLLNPFDYRVRRQSAALALPLSLLRRSGLSGTWSPIAYALAYDSAMRRREIREDRYFHRVSMSAYIGLGLARTGKALRYVAQIFRGSEDLTKYSRFLIRWRKIAGSICLSRWFEHWDRIENARLRLVRLTVARQHRRASGPSPGFWPLASLTWNYDMFKPPFKNIILLFVHTRSNNQMAKMTRFLKSRKQNESRSLRSYHLVLTSIRTGMSRAMVVILIAAKSPSSGAIWGTATARRAEKNHKKQ